MCHLYPYKNVNFFCINICSFISIDKFYYKTRVLDNSYLCFKLQLPTPDSTNITVGGPKITLGSPAPPGRSLADTFLYPKQVLYHTE